MLTKQHNTQSHYAYYGATKLTTMPLLPSSYTVFTPQQPNLSRQASFRTLTHHTTNTLCKPTEQPLTPKWAQLCPFSPQPAVLSVGISAPNLPIGLVQKALTAWETATQQGITFKLTICEEDTTHSDIVFYWTNQTMANTPENPHTYSTGQAWLHIKPIQHKPTIIGSTIELVEHPVIDAYLPKAQQEQRLYTTLLHELGHALGLNHANNINSIMHPKGWRNTGFSQEDVALFKALYTTH